MPTIEIAAGWRQGRGAFGGLTVGEMIRAAEAAVGDPARKVRTVTAELFAAVDAGPAEVTVEVLRTGHSVSVVRVLLAQAEAKAHAVVLLGAHRPGAGPAGWQTLTPPESTPWRQLAPTELSGTAFPEFAAHYEYRFIEGAPFTGGDVARTVAWYPAAMVRLAGPRPMATIAYTLEVVGGVDGLDPDAPLLYRGTVPVCADGYFLETRELWGEDGRLVALNHQTFAIIA
jgi:acyl-CoA thioesterase